MPFYCDLKSACATNFTITIPMIMSFICISLIVSCLHEVKFNHNIAQISLELNYEGVFKYHCPKPF